MATGTYQYVYYTTEASSSAVTSYSQNFLGTRMSGVNSDLRTKVPKFAQIDSGSCTIKVKRSGLSSATNSDATWAMYKTQTDHSNTTITTTIKSQSKSITTSYKTFTQDVLTLLDSKNATAGQLTSNYCLFFKQSYSTSRIYTCNYKTFDMTFTYPTITIVGQVNNSAYGKISTDGSRSLNTPIDIYADATGQNKNCEIYAVPNPGYKFVKWSDGRTEDWREVNLSESSLNSHNTTLTYEAIFEPSSFVTYDSVLNFQKWKNNGISSSNGTVSNITDTGFTLTSNSGVSEATSTSPIFPVIAGESYKIDIDITGNKWDVYIFFYDANTTSGTGIDFADGVTRRFSDGFNQGASFTAPEGATQAVIRVDANGENNTVSFNNFRIYPANYDYMSQSVLASNRSNMGVWNMPTPTRTGYTFTGWNTKPDGSGTNYNSSNSFPTGDLILYSQWIISVYTVNFKNQDGTNVKNSQFTHGDLLGTLPTVSRAGYTFAGWIPCAPAKKVDGNVLDSQKYSNNSFNTLSQQYKYTNNLSIHIEVYMENWMDIVNSQIMSCTEGGGWGLGYMANTVGHGFEVHTGSYSGFDLGFGTEGKFPNNSWHSFDIIFSNGVFDIYVDGEKKGSQTASSSTISYNSSNTIFVGAEAGANIATPTGSYFNGIISNVFIANQNSKLEFATSNTIIDRSIDYYPVWRLNPTYAITTKAEPSDGGIVSGNGNYAKGTTITLTATPNPGYKFVQWSDGSISNPRTLIVNASKEYTAIFEKNNITMGDVSFKTIMCGDKPVMIFVGNSQLY